MSPLRVGPADHLLGRADVVGIGRPDEAVGADEERVLGGPEEGDLLVDEVARGPPSSAARIAMLTLCSSVPVRKRVGMPRIRCQRASASAAITS